MLLITFRSSLKRGGDIQMVARRSRCLHALVPDLGAGCTSDVVVVLTGPRGDSPNVGPEFNATLDRLLEGYELASRWDALLVISGYPGEGQLILNDLNEVRRRLAHLLEPRWQLAPFGAMHTAGNASEVLTHLRDVFRLGGKAKGRRRRVVRVTVVSHRWHLDRVEMLFRGTDDIYQTHLPASAKTVAFQFVFHMAQSRLNPAFEYAFASDEARKYGNDRARLGRWRRRVLEDAPTLIKFVVRTGVAERQSSTPA